MGHIILRGEGVNALHDDEAIQKEIIFYLSACLDFSIKAADCYGIDISEDDRSLKILYDILNTLHHLGKMDPDRNTQ